MADIMHLIKIRAARERVFAAVGTQEGIRGWWTRDAVLDARPGGAGEFGFYGRRMVIRVRVGEMAAPGRMRWGEVTSTGGGFDGTSIGFDLTEQDGVTAVLFGHRGFGDGDAQVAQIASATTRWGFYLLSLKRFVETGVGSPNPEDGELIR